MKITRRQLRRIIKEAAILERSDAIDPLEVDKYLKKKAQEEARGSVEEEVALVKANVKSNGAILAGIVTLLKEIKTSVDRLHNGGST